MTGDTPFERTVSTINNLVRLAENSGLGLLDVLGQNIQAAEHWAGVRGLSDFLAQYVPPLRPIRTLRACRVVNAAKNETEVVQRAMSRAELAATESSGLLRGGRSGTHFASDAVNSTAGRAQQRLALPNTPEVRVTLEVPGGTFSPPTRVQPLELPGGRVVPGGGMERTATGLVPVRIIRVDGL